MREGARKGSCMFTGGMSQPKRSGIELGYVQQTSSELRICRTCHRLSTLWYTALQHCSQCLALIFLTVLFHVHSCMQDSQEDQLLELMGL